MEFFRTYSPQGDGNMTYGNYLHRSTLYRFSEPIPRKGTETESGFHKAKKLNWDEFFRTYSPQGDGNLAYTLAPVASD